MNGDAMIGAMIGAIREICGGRRTEAGSDDETGARRDTLREQEPGNAGVNAELMGEDLPFARCPSAPDVERPKEAYAPTNYVACQGTNGRGFSWINPDGLFMICVTSYPEYSSVRRRTSAKTNARKFPTVAKL